ncbi:unnamed protein product, partial [Polarella glacialis]
LWSFATLVWFEPKAEGGFSEQFAAAAASRGAEFSSRDLAMSTWALATLRAASPLRELSSRASKARPGLSLTGLAAKEVGGLAWGLGRLCTAGSTDTEQNLLDAIAEYVQKEIAGCATGTKLTA